jgi:hypothetical protein
MYCTLTELKESLIESTLQTAVELLQSAFDEHLLISATDQGDGTDVSLDNLVVKEDPKQNKEEWFIEYDGDDLDNVDTAIYLVHRAFQAAEKKGLGVKKYAMSLQSVCTESSWAGVRDAYPLAICINSAQIWVTHLSEFKHIFSLSPMRFRFNTEPCLREHVYGWFEQMSDSIGCSVTRSENAVTVFPQTVNAALYVHHLSTKEIIENIRKFAAVHLATELSKNKRRAKKTVLNLNFSQIEALWSIAREPETTRSMEVSDVIANASKA